jgi:hypothetical protein
MPSEQTLKHNYLKKMQDPNDYVKDKDNFERIVNGYYSVMLRPYNSIYDYEVDSPQTVLDDIDTPFKSLPAGMIGDPMAKYLFIADIPNHPSVDWPFFSLNNSSGFFNEALRLVAIRECDIALANAYGPDEKEHDILKMIESLPNLKSIILMGARAREWFSRRVNHIDISIQFIQHPSYIKRFFGSNPLIMADKIREAIWRS